MQPRIQPFNALMSAGALATGDRVEETWGSSDKLTMDRACYDHAIMTRKDFSKYLATKIQGEHSVAADTGERS